MPQTPYFGLIAVIDWSAASKPGPAHPTADRCWVGWATPGLDAQAEYYRTRFDCMNRLQELAQKASGNTLLAFDFPFGYPAGSGLGGGRYAGKKLNSLFETDDKDSNNRFEVANRLNQNIGHLPGPFWGHPHTQKFPYLTPTKPDMAKFAFTEWRLVEKRLRDQGHRIMNVWQLLGQASVGSQTLTGLHKLNQFSNALGLSEKNVKFWPFETDWSDNLNGVILAEVWPSLQNFNAYTHPIKDARQVMACCDWLSKYNNRNEIKELFSAPDDLPAGDRQKAETEEGWILGLQQLGL